MRSDAHRAGRRDAPDVVAAEVDQHHVLGDLLGVGEELGGERLSASRVRPRGRVPAIGRSVMSRPSLRTRISGEAPTTWKSPKSYGTCTATG
jgi:hypothetical protein